MGNTGSFNPRTTTVARAGTPPAGAPASYSCLSATNGSTCVASRAGTSDAPIPTVSNPPDVSVFRSLIGNLSGLIYWLAITWSFAAFGEEMFYRGYLLNRVADLFGSTNVAWVIAAVLSSTVFALGHGYQGAVGMIDIAFSALIPVVAYLTSGKNLWVPIILHGTGDTLGFILIFLHRYPGL